MTSKLTITDERLAELVAFKPLPGTDINSATRDEWMAMAAELHERRKADSEPVAWLWSRDDERDVSLTPPDDDDDAADAIECGWTATPLYRHAQPAPVVLADGKLRELFDAWFASDCSFDLSPEASEADNIAWRESYWYVWKRCRAAMLQAGNSPVIPEGYVMVPKDLLSELRDWAHPEIEKYCEMWEGRRDSEFPALRKVIADADALLAASPQEVKDGK